MLVDDKNWFYPSGALSKLYWFAPLPLLVFPAICVTPHAADAIPMASENNSVSFIR